MVNDKLLKLETTATHTRLVNKLVVVEDRLMELLFSFFNSENRSKRGKATITAVTLGAFIGVTSIGLYADLKMKVNTLRGEVPKIENLDQSVKDIEITVMDITDNLENLSVDHAELQDSLEIYMLLDQIFLEITETGIAAFIQDLVLANSGYVTSALLSIPQLIKIVGNGTWDWNFKSFFSKESLSMYYPLLNSYFSDSTVVIHIPFSSELQYKIYEIIPFAMNFNGSVYTLETDMIKPIKLHSLYWQSEEK